MAQEKKDKEQNKESIPCVHHWMLESPKGVDTSKGTCKYCSEIRDFPNYIDEPRGSKRNYKKSSQIHIQPSDKQLQTRNRSI